MSVDFGIGSLATFVRHLHETRPILPDDWYEEFDPGFVNYKQYIQSPEWKRKANEAKQRAGYRCQVCNGTGKLDAHHRTYDRLGDERPEDITVLCRDCHKLFSENRRKQQYVYGHIHY